MIISCSTAGRSVVAKEPYFGRVFWPTRLLVASLFWEEPYRVAKTLGSPTLQIIFHKRTTKYRSLLLKMTYKDNGSYESSPPCSLFHAQISNCILHIESNITTGWQKPIKYLIFTGHFLQKSPMISSSFAKNDLRLKASYESSPPCNFAHWSNPISCMHAGFWYYWVGMLLIYTHIHIYL